MGYFTEDEDCKRELKMEKLKNARLLGRWVKVLFWLQILAIVGNVLESDFLEELSPAVTLTGGIIGYGVIIAESVILIRLKEVEDWFYKAGICFLISGLSGFVVMLMILGGAGALAVLFTIAMAIVELRGLYDEYTGFEIVLRNVDDELSGQWPIQWKWEFSCVIVTVIATIMSMLPGLFVILAVITLLAVAIGGIILGIRRMVNMYRTAECFRAYALREETEE